MTTAPRFLVVDEFHALHEQQYLRDELRQQLRALPQVPNARYKVEGDQVFVFERLVDLVEKHALSARRRLDLDKVTELLPQAWVTADVAVRAHDILPWPYKLEAIGPDWHILHETFDAFVPAAYASVEDAQDALAKLLLGQVLPAREPSRPGDFVFNGQPLTPRSVLDPRQLPARPQVATSDLPAAEYSFNWLKSCDGALLEEGRAPLSAQTFSELRELEMPWADAMSQVRRWVREDLRTARLWEALPVQRLNALAASQECDEEDRPVVAQMWAHYPELGALTSGALYQHFDDYIVGCRGLRHFSWEAHRDVEFLSYLAGRLVAPRLRGDDALIAGCMTMRALSRGMSLDQAFEFGRDCQTYNRALSAMAYRVHAVVTWLRQAATLPALQGPEIVVSADLYRRARKVNAAPVQVSQSHAALAAAHP